MPVFTFVLSIGEEYTACVCEREREWKVEGEGEKEGE